MIHTAAELKNPMKYDNLTKLEYLRHAGRQKTEKNRQSGTRHGI